MQAVMSTKRQAGKRKDTQARYVRIMSAFAADGALSPEERYMLQHYRVINDIDIKVLFFRPVWLARLTRLLSFPYHPTLSANAAANTRRRLYVAAIARMSCSSPVAVSSRVTPTRFSKWGGP